MVIAAVRDAVDTAVLALFLDALNPLGFREGPYAPSTRRVVYVRGWRERWWHPRTRKGRSRSLRPWLWLLRATFVGEPRRTRTFNPLITLDGGHPLASKIGHDDPELSTGNVANEVGHVDAVA